MRSARLLALLKDLRLLSNIPQSTNHLLIPIHKGEDCIWDLHVFTKLLDEMLGLP